MSDAVRYNLVAGFTRPNSQMFIPGQYVLIGDQELKKGQDVDIRGTIIPANKITSVKSEWKLINKPGRPEDGYHWVTTINYRD